MPLVEEWHHLDLSEHPLDMLYLNGDKETFKQVLKDFKRNGGLKRYRLASDKSIEKVVKEIAGLDADQISLSLYETYSENLRKAVDQVFTRESDSTLSDQLRANVSRFAAYKALLATREVQTQLAAGDAERAALAVKTYNRFQATEYNTTVSRCRTAKQFIKFDDPDSKRIFPNIRWIPSRSATPREIHKLFWNRIWPKDDPFWLTNTPGSIWNCKCDWEETDDEVTENNPQGENQCAQGLQGNPAVTGKVFSEDHGYFDCDDPRSLVSCYYQDKKSKLKISAIADGSEIIDNINTGRILMKYCENVTIKPHIIVVKYDKNPEYEIDGLIADAKRVHSEDGVCNAFRAALKQYCKIVVLDYNKHNVNITDKTGLHIGNRYLDFIEGRLTSCYVVVGSKVAIIDQSFFSKYENLRTNKKERDSLKGDLQRFIKKALQ